MKLSDVMGNSGLVGWAELALIGFVAAFVAILIWTFARRNRAKFERAKQLPLEDEKILTGDRRDEGEER